MGSSFGQAKNNDLFYLSPEAFQNPDFKRGLVMFLSPEGKSARVFITHESDPATRGNCPGRFRKKSRARRLEDVLPLRCQGLPRWNGGNLQGHS